MAMDAVLFELKKAVGALMMPVPLVLILILVGLLLIWFSRRKVLGHLCVVLALGLLTVSALRPLAYHLTLPLEAEFPAFDGSLPVDYVVVLGSRSSSDPRIPLSSTLSSAGLQRLVEGIRILQLNPNAKLYVSGYSRFDPKSNAEAYLDLAVALGVPAERIIVAPESRDTAEEAQAVRTQIGVAPFALVTSAMHMPRAMALFRQNGLLPIPAPTDFRAALAGEPDWLYYVPDAVAMEQSQAAWHEHLGQLWRRLLGGDDQ